MLSGKSGFESTVEYCYKLYYLDTNCLSEISSMIRPVYSE